MTPAALQLENILGLAYEAKMLGRGSEQTVLGIFTRQCGLDGEFQGTAQARLSALSGAHASRCVITKAHRDFLETALSTLTEVRQ